MKLLTTEKEEKMSRTSRRMIAVFVPLALTALAIGGAVALAQDSQTGSPSPSTAAPSKSPSDDPAHSESPSDDPTHSDSPSDDPSDDSSSDDDNESDDNESEDDGDDEGGDENENENEND